MDGISGSIEPQAQTGLAARLSIRAGRQDGPSAGLAAGHVQGNLAILPRDLAADFLRFCHLNPKPYPVISISEPGSPHIPALGSDLHIRSDLPRYRLWQNGELAEEPADIHHLWREDLVAFAIGCSFSFEQDLLDDDIALRPIASGDNVAMWRTSIPTNAAGPF